MSEKTHTPQHFFGLLLVLVCLGLMLTFALKIPSSKALSEIPGDPSPDCKGPYCVNKSFKGSPYLTAGCVEPKQGETPTKDGLIGKKCTVTKDISCTGTCIAPQPICGHASTCDGKPVKKAEIPNDPCGLSPCPPPPNNNQQAPNSPEESGGPPPSEGMPPPQSGLEPDFSKYGEWGAEPPPSGTPPSPGSDFKFSDFGELGSLPPPPDAPPSSDAPPGRSGSTGFNPPPSAGDISSGLENVAKGLGDTLSKMGQDFIQAAGDALNKGRETLEDILQRLAGAGDGTPAPTPDIKNEIAKNETKASPTPAAEKGIASTYWQPQKLAGGGQFNPNAMTAAHKTLPFGTRVRVTNLNNGRSVEVKINDRGPYVKGRIIDLSDAAGKAIGINRSTAPVTVEVLGKGAVSSGPSGAASGYPVVSPSVGQGLGETEPPSFNNSTYDVAQGLGESEPPSFNNSMYDVAQGLGETSPPEFGNIDWSQYSSQEFVGTGLGETEPPSFNNSTYDVAQGLGETEPPAFDGPVESPPLADEQGFIDYANQLADETFADTMEKVLQEWTDAKAFADDMAKVLQEWTETRMAEMQAAAEAMAEQLRAWEQEAKDLLANMVAPEPEEPPVEGMGFEKEIELANKVGQETEAAQADKAAAEQKASDEAEQQRRDEQQRAGEELQRQADAQAKAEEQQRSAEAEQERLDEQQRAGEEMQRQEDERAAEIERLKNADAEDASKIPGKDEKIDWGKYEKVDQFDQQDKELGEEMKRQADAKAAEETAREKSAEAERQRSADAEQERSGEQTRAGEELERQADEKARQEKAAEEERQRQDEMKRASDEMKRQADTWAAKEKKLFKDTTDELRAWAKEDWDKNYKDVTPGKTAPAPTQGKTPPAGPPAKAPPAGPPSGPPGGGTPPPGDGGQPEGGGGGMGEILGKIMEMLKGLLGMGGGGGGGGEEQPRQPTTNPSSTNQPGPIAPPAKKEPTTAKPVVIMVVNPSKVVEGHDARVSWSSVRTQECDVTDSEGNTISTDATDGTVLIEDMTITTTVTITCSAEGRDPITSERIITVEPFPI
ncbi:MAG: rare lipoprotein A [Parcubacteria group bacterium Gr01-1014_8]|nr:MAG: rare lipoprotein A [Parcubacteria group bacterium Gr01-1014_8]